MKGSGAIVAIQIGDAGVAVLASGTLTAPGARGRAFLKEFDAITDNQNLACHIIGDLAAELFASAITNSIVSGQAGAQAGIQRRETGLVCHCFPASADARRYRSSQPSA